MNTKILLRSAIVLSLALTVGVGCGGRTIRLSKRNREAIRSLAIDPHVQVGETVSYKGPAFDGFEPFSPALYSVPLLGAATVLWALTPVGMYQVSKAYDRMTNALTARIDRAGIDVGDIVYRRFRSEMRKSDLFPAVVSDEGDVTVELVVDVGLSNAWSGLATGTKPWMHVEGKMVDRQGRVLWQKLATVSTFEERTPTHQGQEFFDDPGLFEDAVHIACKIAIEDLIEHLSGR